MDEFDKNMDTSFQKTSLRLLREIFAEQKNRQFLLLTPLDYSCFFKELGLSEDAVAIHRLGNPRDD